MIVCVPCGRTFDRIEALELHCSTEVHRLIAGDDHFESLLRASKKAQSEILGRIRAPLASCEELEARRAVGVLPEFDATPLTVHITPMSGGDA